MREEIAKISVVMPVLNGMPYFEKALTSVLYQTLRELEIVIVDAGSTDGTVEYAGKMQEQDARIRLLHSEKKSVGYQENLGIRKSQGEYVGFVESDDYLEPDMFETLYTAAKKANRPDAVKSDFYTFITEKSGEEFSLYYNVIDPERQSLYGKSISLREYPELYVRDGKMWNGIFRRDFLLEKKIKLNETKGASFQDFGFVWQVNMLAERQLFLQKAFYHYRRDNEGSSVYKKDAMFYILQECKYMLAFLEEHPEEKNIFFSYLLEGMLGFISGRYIRDYYVGAGRESQKEMERFREYLRTVLQKSTDAQKVQLCRLNNLSLFLNAEESFRRNVLENYKASKENRRYFYDYINGWKKTVIFGAKEMGRALAAFLVANEYEGIITFCDNDVRVQNTELMGYRVLSPERAASELPDAVYCIANFKYYSDMKKQLRQLGIDTDRIIAAPDIGIYKSLGLEYKINGN